MSTAAARALVVQKANPVPRRCYRQFKNTGKTISISRAYTVHCWCRSILLFFFFLEKSQKVQNFY